MSSPAGTPLARVAIMIHTSFSKLLITLLPFGLLAAGCGGSEVSSTGQMITCDTDPGTGVILRCVPGGGSGTGTCTDVDEDGDGEPHDEGTILRTAPGDPDDGDDSDDDGVPDEEDCDEQPGEDDCDSDGGVDLPYDVKPELGATTTPIMDAFLEKGQAPASIVSVTLEGGSWRLPELQAGTPFVVTEDDCSHAGNRDAGRDRVVVTWENADGSTESDHLDIRYCER
jgi:hypothetical protein